LTKKTVREEGGAVEKKIEGKWELGGWKTKRKTRALLRKPKWRFGGTAGEELRHATKTTGVD